MAYFRNVFTQTRIVKMLCIQKLNKSVHQSQNFLMWSKRNCHSASPVKCKVALITGGCSGIGYAFAESLLQYGAKVVLLGDLDEKKGKEVEDEFNKKFGDKRAVFKKCDVTKQDEFEDLFKHAVCKYKYLDLLINNAAICKDKIWSAEVDVNVKGLVQGTLFGFKYMGKHDKGRGGEIVNVACISALQPAPVCPVYSGTKGFVVNFSRAMSQQYYECLTGVKVYTICPGITNTAMYTEIEKNVLEGFTGLDELVKKRMMELPKQTASSCGACLIKMLCDGQNGGVWVAEADKCSKIQLPDRHELCVKD